MTSTDPAAEGKNDDDDVYGTSSTSASKEEVQHQQHSSSSAEDDGDEFSWETYFIRAGCLAVDVGAFYHVECGHQRLAMGDLDSPENKSIKAAVDWIEIGRFVDIQDECDPRRVWPAEILENVGGRLLLKYICLHDAGPSFWEFYLAERVHPAGVCKTEVGERLGLHYALPNACDDADSDFDMTPDLIEELITTTTKHTLDQSLFQPRSSLQSHDFEVGMWLEALDPSGASVVYPAKVSDVLNSYFCVLEYDTSMINDGGAPLRRACHSRTPGLFPIGFSGRRGLSFAAPETFDWTVYLRSKGGSVATEKCFPPMQSDDRFIPCRRLEAVNPSASHQICAATVVRVLDNLIWLHFDCSSPITQHTYVTDSHSMTLFPCGWCAANGYPLKAPYEYKDFTSAQENAQNNCRTKYLSPSFDRPTTAAAVEERAYERAYMPKMLLPGPDCPWSPPIYMNGHCYTGPHIDRWRLSTKPCQFGPGPMRLVLKAIAECVISSAFRPREILTELHSVSGPENPFFGPLEVSAKYKSKRWKGEIDFCFDSRHIPEWCHQLCVRLEACPGLLSFKGYTKNEKCSFDCHRVAKAKRCGLAKPLTGMAAKRLRTRLAIQEKRREAAGAGEAPGRKRSRQMPIGAAAANSASAAAGAATNGDEAAVNRPMTRLAKLRSSAARKEESVTLLKRIENGIPPSSPSSNVSTGGNGSEKGGGSVQNGVGSVQNGDGSVQNGGESVCASEPTSGGESSNGGDSATFDEHQQGDVYSELYQLNCGCRYCDSDCCSSPSSPSANAHVDWGHDPASDACTGLCRMEEQDICGGGVENGHNVIFSIPDVETNPIMWTPEQLHEWLRKSIINVGIADQLKEELVDGQAFMLMGIRDVQDYLGLKLGPALKVCGVIKELKSLYLKRYAAQSGAQQDDDKFACSTPVVFSNGMEALAEK